MLRRRIDANHKNGGNNDSDDDDNRYLDSDDQERIVQELQAEVQRQTEQMRLAFSVLCLAMVATTIFVVALDDWWIVSDSYGDSLRMLRVIHALLSAALHLFATKSIPRATLDEETNDDEDDDDPYLNEKARDREARNLLFQSTRLTMASWIITNLFVGAMVIGQARKVSLEEVVVVHYGLWGANLVTLVVSALLQWDGQDSHKALNDVMQAKYRYKSL